MATKFKTKTTFATEKVEQITGSTITLSGTTSFLNPVSYTTDQSSNYGVRSFVDKGFVTGFVTGITNSSLSQSVFNVYSASTLTNINSRLLITLFNTYTGTTAPATYELKSNFNTYTGITTTALNSKLNSSLFNTYTGTTAPLTYQSKVSIITLTGTTLPATYELKSNFNTYTGTTAPATYELKSNFNTYTGITTTALSGKLSTTVFNTFTGTTAPATYLKKSVFNSFTGTTITGATNGLTKVGRHIELGGAQTADILIDPLSHQFLIDSSTTGTGFGIVDSAGTLEFQTQNADLTISNDGTTPTIFTDSTGGQTGLQYPQDYNYKALSLVTAGFVTGKTSLNLLKTTFLTYTGTTAPNTFLSKTNFNSYTGVTNTLIGTKVSGATNGLTLLSNKRIGLGGSISGNSNQQTVSIVSSPVSGNSNNLTFSISRSGYYGPYLEFIAGGNGGTAPSLLINNGSAFFTLQGGVNPSQSGSLVNFTDSRSVTRGIEYAANYSSGFQKYSLVDINYTTGNTVSKTLFNTYTGSSAGVSVAKFNSYTGTTAPATYLSKTAFNTYSGLTLTNINTRLLTSNFNTYSASTLTTVNSKIGSANNGLTKAGTNVHLGGALTGATVIDETSGTTFTLKLLSNNLGVTQVDGKGLWLQNSQVASSGNQQISPAITWEGQGWKTTATAGSQSVKFKNYVLPVQGTAITGGLWTLASSVNGSGNTTLITCDTSGATTINANSNTSLWNLKVKSNNSGWIFKDLFGAGNSAFPAVYDNGVTPSATNYTMTSASNNTYTNINAGSFLRLNNAGNIKFEVMTNSTICMNKFGVGAFSSDIDNAVLANLHVKQAQITTNASFAQTFRIENGNNKNYKPIEYSDTIFNSSANRFVQYTGGTVALQRFNVFNGTNITASTSTTVTAPYTVFINPSTGGTNITLTQNFALGLGGNLSLSKAGNKLFIKEGTNASMGVKTLTGGTAVVATSSVTASSRIFLTVDGGTLTNLGTPYVSARSAGTSFTISSSNALDTSNVGWLIVEPA